MQMFVGLVVLNLALSANASPFGFRIVGGSDAPTGKYPYQVSLWLPDNRFQCGGSIINERYILTAAHCIKGYESDEITIGIGSQLLNETNKFAIAEKLIWHDGFDMIDVEDDIGLIRLAEKIIYTDKVQPIPLATEDFTKENFPVVLSGWGRLYAGGPQPNSLQEIGLKIIRTTECQEAFPVTSNQICTLNIEGEGACNGDSGGPLVADGLQIGIVSYGIPCAVGVPDVYTRVHPYLNWIAENMNLE